MRMLDENLKKLGKKSGVKEGKMKKNIVIVGKGKMKRDL